MMRFVKMTVNGKTMEVGVDEREMLLDTLRDRLGLTSVKRGCEVGECGACTVLLDGTAIDSCLYLTIWCEGAEIITTEGLLARDGTLTPVQQALVDEAAVQCGFCTPGIIIAIKSILDKNPHPTDEEIEEALSGNFCRCISHYQVIEAVRSIL